MNTGNPPLYIPRLSSPLILNGKIDKLSFQKRWGYTLSLNLGRPVYEIVIYQMISGNRFTLYLTDTDLCKKEVAAGKTFSYLTPTYATGTVTGLSSGNTVVAGSGTAWVANVAVGDKFVLSADHVVDVEPDTHWATVLSVNSDTQLTLTGAYSGASSGSYSIRKLYSVPTGERWVWTIVKDKFCFTNGNVNVQYWEGSGLAADLDSANAVRARYCMEYANRLILADLYLDGIRQPLSYSWSKEDDPTNWSDTTAGSADLFETNDFITGLGRVGGNMIFYKRGSIWVYGRTGTATDPFYKVVDRRGIGCIAPYSIVDYLGANFFLGRDDFYYMDSDFPQKVGGSSDRHSMIMHKFFEDVAETECEKTWGGVNLLSNEIFWIANATTGKYAYTYNVKHDEWYMSQFADDMNAFGKGAV